MLMTGLYLIWPEGWDGARNEVGSAGSTSVGYKLGSLQSIAGTLAHCNYPNFFKYLEL